jgi:hypothetical protein
MKDTVRNHFAGYRLSGDQLQRLQDVQSRFSSPLPVAAAKGFRSRTTLVAVLVCLVIAVFAWRHPWDQTINMSSLAAELAYHHNKRMVMEVESASLDEVRAYLGKLDFTPIESQRFPSAEWELVGGRYCSLKGHLAAQLRMRNKTTGETCTFYQLLTPPGVTGLAGTFEDFEQGVKVEIWQERGLLLGVARED